MASAKALRLLDRLRRSKAGAKPEDIKAIYLAFGFIIESRTRHDCVTHPNYPALFGTIPRHRKMANYIAKQAIELAETVIRLEQEKENHHDPEQ